MLIIAYTTLCKYCRHWKCDKCHHVTNRLHLLLWRLHWWLIRQEFLPPFCLQSQVLFTISMAVCTKELKLFKIHRQHSWFIHLESLCFHQPPCGCKQQSCLHCWWLCISENCVNSTPKYPSCLKNMRTKQHLQESWILMSSFNCSWLVFSGVFFCWR